MQQEKLIDAPRNLEVQHIDRPGWELVTTRTEHECVDCQKQIKPGSQAWYKKMRSPDDGSFFDGWSHEPQCMSIGDLMKRGFEDAASDKKETDPKPNNPSDSQEENQFNLFEN